MYTKKVNHGCKGTSNLGDVDEMAYSEFSVDLEDDFIPRPFRTKGGLPYNPSFDRDFVKTQTMSITSRDILAGEEIYDNYMGYAGDAGFKEYVRDLRAECAGGLGVVERYQQTMENGEQFDLLQELGNPIAANQQ